MSSKSFILNTNREDMLLQLMRTHLYTALMFFNYFIIAPRCLHQLNTVAVILYVLNI